MLDVVAAIVVLQSTAIVLVAAVVQVMLVHAAQTSASNSGSPSDACNQ